MFKKLACSILVLGLALSIFSGISFANERTLEFEVGNYFGITVWDIFPEPLGEAGFGVGFNRGNFALNFKKLLTVLQKDFDAADVIAGVDKDGLFLGMGFYFDNFSLNFRAGKYLTIGLGYQLQLDI